MTRVTCQIAVSLDGFAAGPDQSRDDPLGKGGERLHEWMFAADPDPVDRAVVERILAGNGAYVMGRNMFGPIRGAWGNADWAGWWGEDPPFHAPVFVLTHHAREPRAMAGGTTFHFVTDGIEAALAQARAAAGDADVAIAGGASTVRQYLRAGVIEELTVHVAPVLLGAGERPFADAGDPRLEARDVQHSPACTHIRYRVG